MSRGLGAMLQHQLQDLGVLNTGMAQHTGPRSHTTTAFTSEGVLPAANGSFNAKGHGNAFLSVGSSAENLRSPAASWGFLAARPTATAF
mmetsp:Transcript_115300/g.180125  ORF Transcript_115300/g.180125 Transcript_115300/m.180125 type:complete len:89 (-) Transcript_115300:222-488(-)